MKIEVRSTFERDIKKIKDKAVKQKIKKVIQTVQVAESLSSLKHTQKLAGHPYAYRIRVGNYRIGFYYHDEITTLARAKHRKDIYNYFPE